MKSNLNGLYVNEQIWNPCLSWNAKGIESIYQNCDFCMQSASRSCSKSGNHQIKADIPLRSSLSLSVRQQASVNVSSLITASCYSSQISHGKRINALIWQQSALIVLAASPVYMCLAKTNAFLIELNCSIRSENNRRSPWWPYRRC